MIPDVHFSDNASQRTPCVLVLDTSASMLGDPIAQLLAGLHTLEAQLKGNPLTALRVQVLVITAGGAARAEVLVDWCDAIDFDPPHLRADGSTPLGAAMALALDKVEAQKDLYDAHGISSTRPWILLVSDGVPNDPGWQRVAERCRQAELAKRCVVFPIGTRGADLDALGRFLGQPAEAARRAPVQRPVRVAEPEHDGRVAVGPRRGSPDPGHVVGAGRAVSAPERPARWKVVGAAVRGAGHEREGTPLQDAYAATAEGEWLVAAVCDGAGSATLGGLGARVGAGVVAEALAEACAAAPAGPPARAQAFWEEAAREAIKRARRAVAQSLAEAEGGTDEDGLPAFERAHATLVGVVAQPAGGLFLHVGDGLGAAVAEGEAAAVSPPSNGAYANETYFFTQADWDGPPPADALRAAL